MYSKQKFHKKWNQPTKVIELIIGPKFHGLISKIQNDLLLHSEGKLNYYAYPSYIKPCLLYTSPSPRD